MRKLLAVLLAVIMICVCVGCSKIEEEILITSQSSPDNNYTVSLYQVGSPQWSFGPVNAKLVLYDSECQKIDEESFELRNDGGNVKGSNIIQIIWSEDQVEIRMQEFDTTKQYTYILDYSE